MDALHALLIEVRWPDGRFHGVREAPRGAREAMAAEWPPSPFRLFQALVAGAYGGRWAGEEDSADKDEAFAWLERQAAPVILAPPAERLSPLTYFVPNNDLDTREGDPARVGEIRAPKTLRTSAFDPTAAVAYLWPFEAGEPQADRLAGYCERLHTLGLGVDAAFARAQVLSPKDAAAWMEAAGDARLDPAPGPLRPGEDGSPCPASGSLESLKLRHRAFCARFERTGSGRRSGALFRQPPKAQARAVAYARRPVRRLYELRPADGGAAFRPWPLEDPYGLTVRVRDQLARRLGQSEAAVERFVVGRGAGPADAPRRVRILPLASIGGVHTDPRIRRVLVELPPACPIPAAELDWALAGQELADPATGELDGRLLVRADDRGMARRYGVDAPRARGWRTVTPAVLPEAAARRRLDPRRTASGEADGRKDGAERSAEEARAVAAVQEALRHAGLPPAVSVAVQREPFHGRLARAEASAVPGRFPKERLWHVELGFARPQAGPLAIGDGRFCGLGVLAPEPPPRGRDGLYGFRFEARGALDPPGRRGVLEAVRRALMSRAREGVALALFSGHGADGGPARSGQHRHAYLALSPGPSPALWIVAPWRVDRSWSPSADERAAFRRVTEGLMVVRARRLGLLELTPITAGALDGRARLWRSATPYRPDRRPRRGEPAEAATARDIQAACARLGLPRPEVAPVDGDAAAVELRFRRQVQGPLLLGRDAHFGGGLFLPAGG